MLKMHTPLKSDYENRYHKLCSTDTIDRFSDLFANHRYKYTCVSFN